MNSSNRILAKEEWQALVDKNPHMDDLLFQDFTDGKHIAGHIWIDVPFYMKGLRTLIVERRNMQYGREEEEAQDQAPGLQPGGNAQDEVQQGE